MIAVLVQNDSKFDLPSYATKASAGADLKAVLDDPLELGPLERKIVPTGLKIALPELVLVLALNPEVLAFFNLVPLKVLFVIIFH